MQNVRKPWLAVGWVYRHIPTIPIYEWKQTNKIPILISGGSLITTHRIFVGVAGWLAHVATTTVTLLTKCRGFY